MNVQDQESKGERRERKRRQMKVVGRSVRVLQDIIRRRAERLRKTPNP